MLFVWGQSLEVHDQAAHDEEDLVDTSEQNINSLVSSLKSKLSSIIGGGFLSAGEHHTTRGSSSASVAAIVFAAVVILALLIGNFTDFELCKNCLPKRMSKRTGFKPLNP